jgi:hypothetical protein
VLKLIKKVREKALCLKKLSKEKIVQKTKINPTGLIAIRKSRQAMPHHRFCEDKLNDENC